MARKDSATGCSNHCGSRQQIGEDESISLDNFAKGDRYLRAEHRPGACECMELSVFTARIDISRKSREEIFVEASSSKPAIQLARIDARQKRGQAARNHTLGELASVPPPQREDGSHPTGR